MMASELVGHLQSRGDQVHGRGPCMATCPGHEDRSPSLSIRDAGDRILLHCFSGCPVERITESVGVRVADLSRTIGHPLTGAGVSPPE